MDRRAFLERACLSGVALVVGSSVLNSLDIKTLKAKPLPLVPGMPRQIPLRLEDTPELAKVGGAYHLEIEELDKDILVAHVGADKFVAVNIKCTHKGCDVTYNKEEKQFSCPCHSSTFDLGGVPQKGPAKKPLGAYLVEVKDGEVLIHVPVDGDEPAYVPGVAVAGDSTKIAMPADSSLGAVKKDSVNCAPKK